MTWKQCAELPIKLSLGKTTVINGKVYCGGGWSHHDDEQYIVYCYDPPQDKWTALPLLPVKWFGLGQINGKLVAIGGEKDKITNEVLSYDEQSQKWKKTFPPMPTARRKPGVLSLQSALIVAGGFVPSADYTDIVEIFKPDILQWYKTDSLPTGCHDVSLVTICSMCYALGGFKYPSHLNQALYASVDDLLCNAVPTNQTTDRGSSDTRSAWKTLPNTPNYQPAAAMLAGSLLAIGGDKTSTGGTEMKKAYMYSPTTNSWIYISDLPAPLPETAVAILSSTEIFVIGGLSMCNGVCVNTVYKGTLHLKL